MAVGGDGTVNEVVNGLVGAERAELAVIPRGTGGDFVRTFGIPSNYEGTSMACPHVSAIAALIIATGVIGKHPKPQAVEARIKATARDLGPPGVDRRYGAGLVSAFQAINPAFPSTPTT